MRRARLAVLGMAVSSACVVLFAGTAFGQVGGGSDATAAGSLEKVLVFSKTAGFRHASIANGIAAIRQLGSENGFAVDATEDATKFTDANLAQYDLVVWLSTTGDVLNNDQQAAFERYISAGNGYVGIHAAADTEYGWSWYGEMLGGYFRNHPSGTPTAAVDIEDADEPSTRHLPARWTRVDEWYNYQGPVNPVVNGGGNDYSPRNSGVHVLATVDETTYDESDGTTAADDHPIAWCSEFDGGRVWYTGMGHTEASFSEANFVQHLLGGLRTAAGAEGADCGAPRPATPRASDFEKVMLDDDTSNPMELDVAPDGRVFYIERDGRVQIWKPDTNATVLAGTIPVTQSQENGLLGIQLAPDFEQSRWVYLFYSMLPDSSNTQVVSRFKVDGDALDLQFEQKILTFTHQRAQCCHSAGSLYFGPDGSLYISTGDNTNPFESSGFTPIDERTGRQYYDAQRTSANTNDLNGKFLRIMPMDVPTGPPGVGTTYTIPDGNLFPEAEDAKDETRPEIFAMGFRNPFRFTVDQRTGWVLMGDYGPDAGSTNANRGPQGSVEFNTLTEPGNYGWPYCIRDNTPYNDYDFATLQSGPKFDCAAPVNDSPNNTGRKELPLPPSIGADAWMGYTEQDPRHTPNLGTGGAPMGGPRYYFDPDNPSETKFPKFYDGLWFNGEWNNGWIKTFALDAAGSVTKVSPFALGTGYKRPMDLDFGPDGALYVIEWGSGFGGNNADSGIYRIDYKRTNRRPVAHASATPDNGPAPLQVSFSSAGSDDPEKAPLTFEWDFGDGATSTQANPDHTYAQPGVYTASLRATDIAGQVGVDNVRVVVGNTRPEVTIEIPENGQFAAFGDRVAYRVSIADAEDGSTRDGGIDCAGVTVNVSLGHDQHAHELSEATGCRGIVDTGGVSGHGAEANTFTVVEAVYTDKGAPGTAVLTGRDEVVLQPKRKQAEHFSTTGRAAGSTAGGTPGVVTQTSGDPQGGGQNITGIEDGDYVSYAPMNLEDIDAMTFRVAADRSGGRIEVRLDAPNGQLVAATGDIAPTGGAQTFTDVRLDVQDPGGMHALFLVFRNPSALGTVANPFQLMNVNWIDFAGDGAVNLAPQVSAKANPAGGAAPLEVRFDGTASDPDGAPGEPLQFRWDFGVAGTDADTSTAEDPTYTYEQPGTYTATLTVTDGDGGEATGSVPVRVGRNRILVFSKTAGFRHGSIPAGIAAIKQLGAENGIGVDATEDAAQFTDQSLARYGAVAWLSTTGDVLNDEQQAAFERYIRRGGGYVGIHAAADTEYNWRWYGKLVGAYFRNHPANQTATVRVEDRTHASTKDLPESYQRLDEWYNYRSPESAVGGADYSPRGTVHVLATVDEESYAESDGDTPAEVIDGTDSLTGADDHPISWCQRYDGGRSWYTGMGHTNESYAETNFLKHVLGGIQVAMGSVKSDACGNRSPAVTATADPTSGRAPVTTAFTAGGTDPDGDALDYSWDFGDGSTASGEHASHTYDQPGTYTAQVTATDPSGETASDEVVVTVGEANQPPSLTVSAEPVSGKPPLAVSFTADGTDPDGDELFYAWDFGDGNESSEPNPSHTYNTTGTYTARVTVSDGWGGRATGEVVITVLEPNRPPTVTVTAEPTSGKNPLTVAFTANSSDPNGDPLTYAWDFGDGEFSAEQNPSHTYTRRGTYTAEVIVTDPDGFRASDRVQIEVKGGPKEPKNTG